MVQTNKKQNPPPNLYRAKLNLLRMSELVLAYLFKLIFSHAARFTISVFPPVRPIPLRRLLPAYSFLGETPPWVLEFLHILLGMPRMQGSDHSLPGPFLRFALTGANFIDMTTSPSGIASRLAAYCLL